MYVSICLCKCVRCCTKNNTSILTRYNSLGPIDLTIQTLKYVFQQQRLLWDNHLLVQYLVQLYAKYIIQDKKKQKYNVQKYLVNTLLNHFWQQLQPQIFFLV